MLRLPDNLRLHAIAAVVLLADRHVYPIRPGLRQSRIARQLAFRAESELKKWRGEGFVPCLLIISFVFATL